MEEENIEDITSKKDETTEELDSKVLALEEKNRQLFARAKKAEGFELKDDKWVKVEKEEKKPKAEVSKPDGEFGLLQKSYLRSADIVEEDEVELVKKLMEETGKDIDVLIETKYFKSELEELRDVKATTKATSDVRGGRGNTQATDTAEHWIAKGIPPTPEQVPDRATRVKIARAMIASEDTGKKFYND